MRGRFARIVSNRKLREKYRLKETPQLEDRYNIAPMQNIAAVHAAKDANELVPLRWVTDYDSIRPRLPIAR